MKTMGLKSEGLGTTQKVQGGKCLSVWRGKCLSLRWIRTALMGRRGRLAALAIILYLVVAIPLWMQPPVKTHLLLLLSGLRHRGEVNDCGCQQSGPLPSETEVRARIRSTVQGNQGGDSK